MKRPPLLAALLAWAAFAVLATAARAADPVGHWEGAINLPGTQLSIRVDLQPGADPSPDTDADTAALHGTIDIPVQGLRGFALADVVFTAVSNALTFRMPDIPGDPLFQGTLADDGQRLTGTFSQGGQSFPFTLDRRADSTATAGETPSRGVPGTGLAGHWQGSLQAGPTELRLALHVQPSADDANAFTATVDSLDQGAMNLPVDSITLDAHTVRFTMPPIGASFTGELSEDGSEITGLWQQGPGNAPLVFRRLSAPTELKRPQEPTPPYPYDEREVSFTGGAPDVTLAGTLTLPRGAGPFPAVVLLTGSGPQDRNETLMGHRPFLVLADHLTRQSIAVLRYDDRGFGESTGNHAAATIDDFAADGRAALEFLKKQPGIDPSRVGLCGHSEGGLHAPLIAAGHDDVAFIVMLAGVGVPSETLLHRQRDDIMRVLGINEENRMRQRDVSERIFAVLRRSGATDAARAEIRTLFNEAISPYTAAERAAMGFTDGAIEQQIGMMTTPWFVDLLQYDPAPALAQVDCPVLALNGKKDLQVAWEENLDGIRAGLAAGGNTAVTTHALPDLNHLFQHATTGAISEYGTIEETISPQVLTLVADWIIQQPGS